VKYLSPKQLGLAIGVSESSLKRWIDDGQIAVSRTTGGHRRIELTEAVRFVRQRGYTIDDPAVLGLSASDAQLGRADHATQVGRLHDMLTQGKSGEFLAAVTRLYLDGRPLAELIDGPIRESMRRIGELWHNNPDGVGIEHRATDICIRTLGYLHSLIKPPVEGAPLALGGAPPGDMHLIPSLCISLVLAEQGWREMNLGANTPWEQFSAAATRERASLVWLSMTAQPKGELAPKAGALADALAPLPCQLVVGGQQVNASFARLTQVNLHAAGSMTELIAFSKGLLAAHLAGRGTNGVSH
jgi:methanogenic corrinoid protein MtbC1